MRWGCGASMDDTAAGVHCYVRLLGTIELEMCSMSTLGMQGYGQQHMRHGPLLVFVLERSTVFQRQWLCLALRDIFAERGA